ncbi:MAG TPA: FAD-dependent tricarballylate dehydrogenase TcuA [Trebonia sp.]
MVSRQKCDVIVIGGGSAAHEAAVAARYHGARQVIMLEKAPRSQSGGNARFSGTGFRFAFEPQEIQEIVGLTDAEYARLRIRPYTAGDFLGDLKRVTRNRIDPELAELLVGESNEAVRWSREVGLQWELQPGIERDGLRYFSPGIPIHPLNLGGGMTNGLSQMVQWWRIAERFGGVELRCESKVIGFLGDESGVTGVRVLGPEGVYEIEAPATIACSGGFQANPELRARYLGPNADIMKTRGSRHNTGEVLQMMLGLGAAPAGNWQGAHASPIDASAPEAESGDPVNRYGYCWGITVNALGQRFIDEGEAEISYTYAKTGWAVLRQPGGVAYQLGDAKHPMTYMPDEPLFADSIDELAGLIGVDPTLLAGTIGEFNAAIDTSIRCDRTVRDGRRTNGLSPDKSNWATSLDTPPYFALPVTGGITFTFGGVRVDTNAQVIANGGRPIPGLYASGDVVGLFFHNYASMTGQTRNLVFSRRAAVAATR